MWLQQAVTGSGKVEKKIFRLLRTQFRRQFKVKSTRGIKWIGLVRSKNFALPLGHKLTEVTMSSFYKPKV